MRDLTPYPYAQNGRPDPKVNDYSFWLMCKTSCVEVDSAHRILENFDRGSAII
jgi:hypothetical protein